MGKIPNSSNQPPRPTLVPDESEPDPANRIPGTCVTKVRMSRPHRILIANEEPALRHLVKNVLCGTAPVLLLLFCLSPAGRAQDTRYAADDRVQPSAVTLSTHGQCDYSTNGVALINFRRGQIFEQGAVLRTGKDATADLFFRRTGTIVRLQSGTEVRLEKMSVTEKDGLSVVDTLLDLRSGRIFTVVRSAIVGNTFEIRNAAGRSVVAGSGIGRYIITADGTHVSAIGSNIPLKVIGETGITVITAGQQFDKKAGRMFPASTTAYVNDLIQLDELQAIMDAGHYGH